MTDLLRERYELLEVVGYGGEGRVVKALDHQHNRVVALKLRKVASQSDRDDLLAEARILLAVSPHPNVSLVREDFFEGDEYVIAMDWVEGTNLAQLLQARGRPGLAPSLVMRWLAEAAEALTHLHTQESAVIHGDLKPANLILTKGGHISLVDFGLSSAPDAPRRRGGTRGYAAPELAAGEAPSRASDVYSLAATAFTLLTGEPPSGIRPTWDGLDDRQADVIEAAIRAGLATDPTRRPSTPGAFVERLRAGWGETLPTGVLTFCLTDIEGSTAMWEANAADMAAALVLHDELIAATVEERGGRFLKSMGEGDATVSVFGSPEAAVDAAVAIVRGLAAAEWPEGFALRARVAVHTGEAEQRDGDYFGTTLNTAARIRSLANGGQIFLSSATADVVRPHLGEGVDLVDLGPHRLRGLRDAQRVHALRAAGIDAPPPDSECPYPGLISFGPDDADVFFGRDAVVDDLVARLNDGLLAVVGGSGSGKSSVLRAGLLARRAGAVITPGTHPLAALEAAPRDGLLVVDQFEELFTLCDDAPERDDFITALLSLDRPVALGLRADFYGACAPHADLAAAIAANQVLLGPMTRAELHDAIERPAHRGGLQVEPALVEVLVNEVAGEPGALPLLSHALRATWEVRENRTLTLDGYRSTGGVRGAIAATADRALASLSPADRDLARRLFLRLVEPGEGVEDTRRRAALDELAPAGEAADRANGVLDLVAAARLVTVEAGTVEVAHEALIREWPTLRQWLDDDRESLRLQRHLTAAAAAWDGLRRDPDELYRGPRLAAAVDWLRTGPLLSVLEQQFLDASTDAADAAERGQARAARRLRVLLSATAVGLVIALIAATIAVIQGRQAGTARNRADVSRIAAISRSLSARQPDLGLLLGTEAFRRADNADTRSTLLAALTAQPLLDGLIYGASSGLESAAFSANGSRLFTATADGSGVIEWDIRTHKRVAAFQHGHDILLGAALSPDGKTLAVPALYQRGDEYLSRLQVWNVETHRLLRMVPSPAGGLSSAWFSADGTQLVTQGGPVIEGSFPTKVVVWDVATWTPRGDPWVVDADYVGDRAIAVSADGALLAVPSTDGRVTVWDTGTRQKIGAPIEAGVGLVHAVAFARDKAAIAIAGDLDRVVLVDPVTGQRRAEAIPVASTPTALEFAPNGHSFAVADVEGRTQLIDAGNGNALGPPLAANAASVNDIAFSADGSKLATVGVDRIGAIWRLDGSRPIGGALTAHATAATEVAYANHGEWIVSGGNDGVVAVHRARSGRSLRRMVASGEVMSLAITRDQRHAVIGTTSGDLQLVDLARGRVLSTMHLADGWIHQIAINPRTGVTAVTVNLQRDGPDTTGPDAGFVAFFDPELHHEVSGRVPSDNGAPIALAWSPSGDRLALGQLNNELRFLDGVTHKPHGDPIDTVDTTPAALAYSPDGARLAVGTSSGTVLQWTAATQKEIGVVLRGLTGEIGGVAFSSDGTMLAATTLGYSTTQVWNARTGTPIGSPLAAGRTVFTEKTFVVDHIQPSRPAFSVDGTRLAVPTIDGLVTVWDLRPAKWLAAACASVGRSLSRAEWRQYIGPGSYRATCPSDSR